MIYICESHLNFKLTAIRFKMISLIRKSSPQRKTYYDLWNTYLDINMISQYKMFFNVNKINKQLLD